MNRSLLAECYGEFWLLSLLPPAPLIVDVGVHEGRFSQEALRQRPKRGSLDSSRPSPCGEDCRPRSPGNPGSNCSAMACLIGGGRWTSSIQQSGDGCSSLVAGQRLGKDSYRVETVRLDDFAEERGHSKIEMLKIDAEGYDLLALEGAERLLDRQAVDMLSFEHNVPWIDSRHFLRDAWDFLASKSYSMFRLFNGFLAPFRYAPHAERHDLGCIYVGVSRSRLGHGDIPIRALPV